MLITDAGGPTKDSDQLEEVAEGLKGVGYTLEVMYIAAVCVCWLQRRVAHDSALVALLLQWH